MKFGYFRRNFGQTFFTYKERPLHISDEEEDEDEQNDDEFVGLR